MNQTAFFHLIFGLAARYPRVSYKLLRAFPLGFLRALRGPRLRQTLRCALRAPFYQEAFTRAGIRPERVRRPEDLGEFFLTSEALKTHSENLLCAPPELAIESSGTSGHISKVYLSRSELEYNARQAWFLYSLYDLGPEDRLLCTLDLAFGLGAVLVDRGMQYMQLFSMVVGRVDPVEAYQRLSGYRFNVLVSDPFWLVRLTEIARERGKPAPLKLLIGGGEGVTNRTRSDLEHFWGAPLYMTYASTEAATILGFECPYRSGYHVNEFDFYVEIDRPNEEGFGELVLTTVNRKVMPLIRYRTNDVARWLPGACPCGLPFRRISPLRGRLDEMVSCAWGNVYPDFFERILRSVPGLSDEWQVALQEREGKQTFQFRLELANGFHRNDEIKEHIVQAIQQEHPSAWQAVSQKLAAVDFVFHPPQSLRQGRKLLRLVDERTVNSLPPPH